jgi:hypothetical protein
MKTDKVPEKKTKEKQREFRGDRMSLLIDLVHGT